MDFIRPNTAQSNNNLSTTAVYKAKSTRFYKTHKQKQMQP